MTQAPVIWLGEAHLRARSAERSRWIGGLHEARGVMVLPAATRPGFEAGLRKGLDHLGYDLVALLDAGPADDMGRLVTDHAELAEVSRHARADRPLPLGGFHAIAQGPAQSGASWVETDWRTLLSAPVPLWAVIDGVSWPEIQQTLSRAAPEHDCLYSTLDPDSRALAPWLVRVTPDSDFVALLQSRPQADHAFVLFQSDADLAALRRHFRRFTMLNTPADPNAPVYFRFYDPRVLIDAITAMRPAFLARLAAPVQTFIVPLTPLCLVPPGAALTGGTVDPFGAMEDCQGRLLVWRAPEGADGAAGSLRVDDGEFAVFEDQMRQRAALKLARMLHAEQDGSLSEKGCIQLAHRAAATAERYGMRTVSQVTVMARVMMAMGDDFAERDPDARQVLNDPALLPWQKKDRLVAWFVTTSQKTTPPKAAARG